MNKMSINFTTQLKLLKSRVFAKFMKCYHTHVQNICNDLQGKVLQKVREVQANSIICFTLESLLNCFYT